MLIELDPTKYKNSQVVYERGEKVLYLVVLKAIYGMLQSAILFYKKFRKDLESVGFEVNPYDPCVANRSVNGNQHTVTWHVDDLKSSHVDPKVNDDFLAWLEMKYGSEKAPVVATRGKRHDYLGMILDYTEPGKVKVDMVYYVENMVKDFPEELNAAKGRYPWNEHLFRVDKSSKPLDKKKAEQFHTFVAKGLFLTKRARGDIMPAIAYLCTRVKDPTESDWVKLRRMMTFLKRTKHDVLTLQAYSTNIIKWHLDASFAVHYDF